MDTGALWESVDIHQERVSKTQIKEVGISLRNPIIVKDLDELRKYPPSIVIARAVKTFSFVQNDFKTQIMRKNNNYIMSLGTYQQLHKRKLSNKKQIFLKPSNIKFKNVYRPYTGQDLNNKTLLVSRTGGIGDLLFIQPNLRYLKQKYPTCKIIFSCGPQYQSMVATWDCIDEIIDLPFSSTYLISADYHAFFEGVIERCKLAEKVNAYHLFSKWLNLNLPSEQLVPKQEAKPELVEECKKWLEEQGLEEKQFLVVQIRASSPIRTPSLKLWKKVLNVVTEYGYKIVITDTPRVSSVIDSLIKSLDKPDHVFNFASVSQSLDYSIALCSLSMGGFSTDSALIHIMASLDLPAVGIYGPFPGHIRLSTYPKAVWIDVEKECAPCFLHGHKPCPKAGSQKASPCYENLNIDEFATLVKQTFPVI